MNQKQELSDECKKTNFYSFLENINPVSLINSILHIFIIYILLIFAWILGKIAFLEKSSSLLTPLTLIFIAVFVTKRIADEQNKINQDKQKQELLTEYLKQMTELLVERELNSKDPLSSEVQIAKALTLNIIRELDWKRNQQLTNFLYDTKLIQGNNQHELTLLMGGNFDDAELKGACLQEADLKYAHFKNTNLEGVNFSKACLKTVNFKGANLKKGWFKEADLEYANLEKADFRGAIDLTLEQVKKANNWELAIYDTKFREQLKI